MRFRTIDLCNESATEVQHILKNTIVPRPIALVSSIDQNGHLKADLLNFFNLCSVDPPRIILSSTCDDLNRNVGSFFERFDTQSELVINMVNHRIMHQALLASSSDSEDDFQQGSLRPIKSDKIKPPRVGEANISLECKVDQKIVLDSRAENSLLICEVLTLHIAKRAITANGEINQYALDTVSKLGYDYYLQGIPEAIFEVEGLTEDAPIGINQLPDFIRNNEYIEKSHLGRLGRLPNLPEKKEWKSLYADQYVAEILDTTGKMDDKRDAIILYATMMLENEETDKAMQLLYLANEI